MRRAFLVFPGILLASVLYAGKPQKQQHQRVRPTPTPNGQRVKHIAYSDDPRRAGPGPAIKTPAEASTKPAKAQDYRDRDDFTKSDRSAVTLGRDTMKEPAPTVTSTEPAVKMSLPVRGTMTSGSSREGQVSTESSGPSPGAVSKRKFQTVSNSSREGQANPELTPGSVEAAPTVTLGTEKRMKGWAPGTAKKATPAPEVDSINLNSSRSNIYRARTTPTVTPVRRK